MLQTDEFGIPKSSSSSQTVNRRFSLIAARTLLTISAFLAVEGLPDRFDSLTLLTHNASTTPTDP
ncbi:hypothetical protein J6590_078908 [Homalodisca vitripennis]|nr:hypothetical protein J6590_078908 [Homalodisca vitripennis]